MILFFLIYLFFDISLKDLNKKENLLKYSIALLMFGIQNFLFFIFPNLIFDFFFILFNHDRGGWIIFYLKDLATYVLYSIPIYIENIFIFLLIGISVILLFNKTLKIEEKFGFLALGCIFFSPFTYLRALVIYLPFVLLLIIPFIKFNLRGFTFLRKNKIELISITMIVLIYFHIYGYVIFNYFPILSEGLIAYIVYLRYVIVMLLLGFCVLLLYVKKRNFIRLNSRISVNNARP